MKYFSTFSGIGGFELGIKQAYESNNEYAHKCEKSKQKKRSQGRKRSVDKHRILLHDKNRTAPLCVGYSEIDKYAIQVYNKQFNHKNYGDITKIDTNKLPNFDLLVGGFPCQAFSIAGKRKGFNDTRGTLFFDLARILRDKRPGYFVFENVKGLLSHDSGKTFQTILGVLSDLGYRTEWQVLNSKNFGVPQNRERVFIVGHLREKGGRKVFPIGEDDKISSESNEARKTQSQTSIASTIRTKEGTRADDNFIITQEKNKQPFIKIQEATKKGYAEAREGQSINLSNPNSKTRRGRVSNIAQTLDTGMQQHTLVESKIRRLTPIECERLQGFPTIEKYDIIQICKENQKKNVNVEDQNRKSQKLVGNVEKEDLQENAKYVARFLNTKNQQIEKPVHPNVLINCEESGVEIHSQEKLLLSAKFAGKKDWSHQHIKIEDFVQMIVGINTILEKITNYGEVELRKNERCLTLQRNGKRLENLYGNEIMLHVGDAKNDLITLKKLLKSTTLDHLDIKNLEQRLKILSLFAIRAIIGYIPNEIKNQNTFTIALKNKYGWTARGTEGKISDTQRYKMCGNAVTVNVVENVISRLL